MTKVLIGVVALLLLATASCYQLDVEDSPVAALLFPAPEAPEPEYADDIGTPADVELPQDIDFEGWFLPEDERGPDVDEHARLTAMAAFHAEGQTTTGWAEVCPLASQATGDDRIANPEIGALACSDDPYVTLLQRFAVHLLGTQAHTALWMRGAPGYSVASIESRQAEMRLMCTVEVIARRGGEDSPYARACTLALDEAYQEGDAEATLEALDEAYGLLAEEIAAIDPTVAAEPAFYPGGGDED
ncbi:MAG: hypothetical protein U5Q44_04455 [Dehalococcoidia bacterium]|nr:hypothetical protein [Dehalococcoidia bacterium]